MFLFCSVKDLWYFFTGFLWSLVSFLRALNFPVSQFMSGLPQSMFSSKCSSSRHFYCPFFSTGLLCFLCRGIFFIVQNECLLAGLYPEGRHDPLLMMGVLLFCHMFAMTWDPSRVDVQGERLAADSSLAQGKTGQSGPAEQRNTLSGRVNRGILAAAAYYKWATNRNSCFWACFCCETNG